MHRTLGHRKLIFQVVHRKPVKALAGDERQTFQDLLDLLQENAPFIRVYISQTSQELGNQALKRLSTIHLAASDVKKGSLATGDMVAVTNHCY
ncbi:uncharacterized protein LOC143809042 isoform X2 [Ranitomeya variabilis]|uniref:uncharacterized protein LOC143809042 isoform X2 n=1 Tax=Ranitomeya variabilis TaxID=490064 RepID=UPI0040562FEC